MLLVFEDVTDRKQRERDAQMLTNEISHRTPLVRLPVPLQRGWPAGTSGPRNTSQSNFDIEMIPRWLA
jgi:hypothetical protein